MEGKTVCNGPPLLWPPPPRAPPSSPLLRPWLRPTAGSPAVTAAVIGYVGRRVGNGGAEAVGRNRGSTRSPYNAVDGIGSVGRGGKGGCPAMTRSPSGRDGGSGCRGTGSGDEVGGAPLPGGELRRKRM